MFLEEEKKNYFIIKTKHVFCFNFVKKGQTARYENWGAK